MGHLTRSHAEKHKLATEIVAYLNELLDADPVAIRSLMDRRVECNTKLVDHPTVQVTQEGLEPHRVGLLGIINGLIGVDKIGWGYVAGEWDDDGLLRYFLVRWAPEKCKACSIEAEIGTEEVPHPVDPRLHTCLLRAETCTPSP